MKRHKELPVRTTGESEGLHRRWLMKPTKLVVVILGDGRRFIFTNHHAAEIARRAKYDPNALATLGSPHATLLTWSHPTVWPIDNEIFNTPIKTGYAQGLTNLYDSMLESRTAALALILQKD